MHFAHVRHIFFIAVFAAGGVMLEFCNVINYKKQNIKFTFTKIKSIVLLLFCFLMLDISFSYPHSIIFMVDKNVYSILILQTKIENNFPIYYYCIALQRSILIFGVIDTYIQIIYYSMWFLPTSNQIFKITCLRIIEITLEYF